MKIRVLLRLLITICLPLQVACTLNYPERVDAELFLPLISGFETGHAENDFNYLNSAPAYRISKALEHEYISLMLENIEPAHYCDGKPRSLAESTKEPKSTLIGITKILEPFEWQPLEENRGIYKNENGGVLFGRGVRLSKVTLLSLRYVLTPLESPRYTWSPRTRYGKSLDEAIFPVAIPYRYVELEEIAFSDAALKLFDESIVIHRCKNDTDNTAKWNAMCQPFNANEVGGPKCHLRDEVELVVDPHQNNVQRQACGVPPGGLLIKASRETTISFSDGPNLSPVNYRFPDKQVDGWIDVVNLSYDSTKSSVEQQGRDKARASYMQIVRALTLAQAGDCDRAYTVYKEKIANTSDLDTRNKVLSIIAYLHGQSRGDITGVLKDLVEIRGEDDPMVRAYEFLNRENLGQTSCSFVPAREPASQ